MKQYNSNRKEQSQINGKFCPKGPKSRKEENEFGVAVKNVLLCEKCDAVYWLKSWHHHLVNCPKLKELKNLKFALCPACQMIKDKKFEGEIILEDVPEEYKKEIIVLIQKYGERAFEEDPMDRVISIEENRVKRVTATRKRGSDSRKEFKDLTDIRVLTTENQLATRLSKKINESFGKKFSVTISHSHEEDTSRIRIKF